jgi:hypothetical protein
MGDQQYPEPPELMRIQEMLMQAEDDGGEAGVLQLRQALTYFVRHQIGGEAYSYLPILREAGQVDPLFGGRHSCAYFVLSCLHQFGLVSGWNTWVDEVQPLLEAAGWKKTSEKDISVMDIVIYDQHNGNRHIGFYNGRRLVISTALTEDQLLLSLDDQKNSLRTPQQHDWKYERRTDGPRTIQSCWTHRALHG